MKPPATRLRILLLGGVALGVARPAPAPTADQIIAQARAYLGGDAALSAVNSIHFSGVVETDKVTPAGLKTEKVGIDIILQKPYQQRIVVTGSESIETTALDDYTAWQRTQKVGDRYRWKLSVLGPDQIKWLRANTWEDLHFFKGIEERGGTVEVLGSAAADGHPAVKLAFTHDAGIVYTHYFDPETGKLLLSETTHGESIRTETEIMVNGLRFPQRIIQTAKGLDDKGQPAEGKLVMTFDKITLNETFPESYFELPLVNPVDPPRAGNPPGPPPAVNSPNSPPAPGPDRK